MVANAFKKVIKSWPSISQFMVVSNEEEYNSAVERMEGLLEIVGEDEDHPLASLLDTISTIVLHYENDHYPRPPVKGEDSLRFLMDQHGLKQSDLPEVGSQGVVSEVLNGKRKLNARQIEALRRRFNVPADVFFDD